MTNPGTKSLVHFRSFSAFLFALILLFTHRAAAQTFDLTMDVLVNSKNATGYSTSSTSPGEYQRYVERYLEHLQIPYRVIDTATQTPPSNLASVQLIVAAHTGLALSSAWQQAILQAVEGGTGFVNFDADPSIGTNIHIQGIFGATGSNVGAPATSITVPAAVMPDGTSPHYIAAMQMHFSDTPSGDLVYNFHPDDSYVQRTATPTILQGAQGTVIAKVGGSPLILATETGGGRAVDFTTYDFMHPDRFGFMMGIDDLIWRSFVWAARKPFILRGYPRLWASQMDDEGSGWGQRMRQFWDTSLTGPVNPDGSGGPWKVNANAQIVTMASGSTDRADAIADVNSGYMKICLHTVSGISEGDLYWNAQSPNALTDDQWQSNLAYALQVVQGAGGDDTIPSLSKAMVPHYWNLSNNVGYDMWHSLGTRYITEVQMPGAYYEGLPRSNDKRIMLHPFRIYELPPTGSNPNELYPLYYADFMTVGSRSGQPAQKFFAFATQLLGNKYPAPDASWPVDSKAISVQESVNNWNEYTWRFFSGMAPVQIYNHEGDSFAEGTPAEQQQAIQQISSFLNANKAIHVFMEDEGAYMAARTQSVLTTAQATPSTISLNFTGTAADMDGNLVPTKFYLFYGDDEGIQQQVSGFTNGYTFSMTNAAPKAIGLSNSNLLFSVPPGSAASSQTVTVSNTGSGILSYTAQSNASWLTVTGGTGTMPDTLTVSANPTGLAAGTYSGTIQINSPGAANSPRSISVTLDVLGPKLGVDSNGLSFTGSAGHANPGPQSITITNTGIANLNWTASSSATWLQLGASSGTVAAGSPYSLSITPNIAGLQPGTYSGTVTISSSNALTGSPQTINVSLIVALMQCNFPGSALDGWAYSQYGQSTGWTVASNSAQFNGSGSSQIYAGNANWSNYTLQTGFHLSSLNNYPGGIRGYIDRSTGASYAAWIYPSEGVIRLWRTTTWKIDDNHVLLGTSAALTMDATQWHTIALSMNGGQVSVLYDGNTVISASDTTLTGGMIGLEGSSQPIQFNNLLVIGGQVTNTNLTTSQASFNLSVPSRTLSSGQSLQIDTSDGSVAVWSSLSSSSWVSVTPSTGQTPNTVTVQVNAANLTPGNYTGQLTLTSLGANNSPQSIPINVTVTDPPPNQFTVSPSSLSFTAVSGAAAPPAQSLSLTALYPATSFTVSSDAAWLSCTASGSTSQMVQVNVNQAGLAIGTYIGHLTINAPTAVNPTTTVTVTLVVANPLSATPASLDLVGSTTANSTTQSLSLASLIGTPINWTGSFGSSWFSPSATSGSTPATIQVAAATSGMSIGTYTDTYTLSAQNSSSAPLLIPISLRVGPTFFSDTFSSNSNWTASPLGLAGNWTVANNTYSYNGGGPTQQYAGDSSWTDYTFQTDVTLSSALNYPGGVRFRLNTATGAGYALWLYPGYNQVTLLNAPNWNIDSGSSAITSGPANLSAGTHHLRIDVKGTSITVFVDSAKAISLTDPTYSTGAIAFDVSNQPISFSNVSVIGYRGKPAISLASSNPSSFVFSPVTFTATVSGGPTGVVTFYDNGEVIGSGTINGTTASFTTSALSIGAHSITASWPGDANYYPVTSAPLTQTVNQLVPSLSIATSGSPSDFNSSVTFTATISSGPTGSVMFYDNGTAIGSGTINGTTATFTTSGLSSGSHSITVTWAGDADYGSVTSAPITQVVNAPPTVPGTVYEYSITQFDPNGNIRQINDSINGNWSYDYDSLNRLQSATSTAVYCPGLTLSWSYDAFGNRKSQTVSGSSNCSAVQPSFTFTNNRIDQYSYDANGNVQQGDGNSYTYDAEGRLSTVNGYKYIYDAEGNRVAKVQAGTNAVISSYVIGLSGEQVSELDSSGQVEHSNVFANGQLIATYDASGTIHYHLNDWLGTRRAQVAASGLAELICRNLPFGDRMQCSGSADATEEHFTGKVRDSESGNDYFGARYYASTMGRFMSPDWNDSDDLQPVPYADLENPQSLNLYSYVQNNPVTARDQNGHYTCNCQPMPNFGQWELQAEEFFANVSEVVREYWQKYFRKKVPVVPPVPSPANTANPNPKDKKPKYEKSQKHGRFKKGNVSAAPKDGQTALDNSVQVKDTSPRRVGVDPANDEIVVLDQTSEGVFHGHVRTWGELTSQMQNALTDAGLTTPNGTIIKP